MILEPCSQPRLSSYDDVQWGRAPKRLELMECDKPSLFTLLTPQGTYRGQACRIHRRDLAAFAHDHPELGFKVVEIP